jgi:hypothetical protein
VKTVIAYTDTLTTIPNNLVLSMNNVGQGKMEVSRVVGTICNMPHKRSSKKLHVPKTETLILHLGVSCFKKKIELQSPKSISTFVLWQGSLCLKFRSDNQEQKLSHNNHCVFWWETTIPGHNTAENFCDRITKIIQNVADHPISASTKFGFTWSHGLWEIN